jgi:hypothetical protein
MFSLNNTNHLYAILFLITEHPFTRNDLRPGGCAPGFAAI